MGWGLLVKETDVQFDDCVSWPFRQAKCRWSIARLKQRPSRWYGQPDRTHKHIPPAEAEWLRQPAAWPPVSVPCIIKPLPQNSLLVTMTHFPSIPQAARSEIVYHEVLKGAQIVLFLSSPLSSKFTLHLLSNHKSLPALLPNTHTHTHTHTHAHTHLPPNPPGGATEKARGSAKKQFHVLSFSHWILLCAAWKHKVWLRRARDDHGVGYWSFTCCSLTYAYLGVSSDSFYHNTHTHTHTSHFFCFAPTKISTQVLTHKGYLWYLAPF